MQPGAGKVQTEKAASLIQRWGWEGSWVTCLPMDLGNFLMNWKGSLFPQKCEGKLRSLMSVVDSPPPPHTADWRHPAHKSNAGV